MLLPAGALDWTPWLALGSLEHLHLHINPAWRAPLQPAALEAMAAAWPHLSHLHLRLSPSDNATHALQHLVQFKALKSLSLTWLGQAGPGAGAAGAGALRSRRGSSLESAAFNLAYLPTGLQVGAMAVCAWRSCGNSVGRHSTIPVPAAWQRHIPLIGIVTDVLRRFSQLHTRMHCD